MSKRQLRFIKIRASFTIAFTLMVVTLMVAAAPIHAADPIFPIGSRVGLVPPTGMEPSETFPGFADANKEAAILITILPAAAYSQIEKTLDSAALKKRGLIVEKREPVHLDIGNGVLITARQLVDKTWYRKWLLIADATDLTVLVSVQAPDRDNAYSDRLVRAMLNTLTLRPQVPEAEELSLLPFSVGDLAGFRVDGVVRGRALMLSDAPTGRPEDSTAAPSLDNLRAHLLIAAMPGGPTEPADYANFARLSFNEIGGVRDIRVTMSEPLRLGGQMGYQTMAEAKDARNGAAVMVVQWLRFGSGGFLQMVGIAPADSWTRALARLRTVRDSVEPRSR